MLEEAIYRPGLFCITCRDYIGGMDISAEFIGSNIEDKDFEGEI